MYAPRLSNPELPFVYDRYTVQRHYAETSDQIATIPDAHTGLAAELGPDFFYSQALRIISTERLGDSTDLPSQEQAYDAFLDFTDILTRCTNEPQAPMSTDLTGVRWEAEVLAAMAGARVCGIPVAARSTSAKRDYHGGTQAADIKFGMPDSSGDMQTHYLQLKTGLITRVEARYDLNQVIIVSKPLLAKYLPKPKNPPVNPYAPYYKRLRKVGNLTPTHTENDELTDEETLIAQTLTAMSYYGEALMNYVRERPDMRVMHNLLNKQNNVPFCQPN